MSGISPVAPAAERDQSRFHFRRIPQSRPSRESIKRDRPTQADEDYEAVVHHPEHDAAGSSGVERVVVVVLFAEAEKGAKKGELRAGIDRDAGSSTP